MDRKTWRATVHRVAESQTTEGTAGRHAVLTSVAPGEAHFRLKPSRAGVGAWEGSRAVPEAHPPDIFLTWQDGESQLVPRPASKMHTRGSWPDACPAGCQHLEDQPLTSTPSFNRPHEPASTGQPFPGNKIEKASFDRVLIEFNRRISVTLIFLDKL